MYVELSASFDMCIRNYGINPVLIMMKNRPTLRSYQYSSSLTSESYVDEVHDVLVDPNQSFRDLYRASAYIVATLLLV